MNIFQVLLHKRKHTGLDLAHNLHPAVYACSKYRQSHKQQRLVVREGVNGTNDFWHDVERGV